MPDRSVINDFLQFWLGSLHKIVPLILSVPQDTILGPTLQACIDDLIMQCTVLIPMAVIRHSSQNIGLPVCGSSLSWLVNWKTGRCSYRHKIVIEDVLLVSLFLERLNLIHSIVQGLLLILLMYTAQKMKFSIKDFLSKCDQIRGPNPKEKSCFKMLELSFN